VSRMSQVHQIPQMTRAQMLFAQLQHAPVQLFRTWEIALFTDHVGDVRETGPQSRVAGTERLGIQQRSAESRLGRGITARLSQFDALLCDRQPDFGTFKLLCLNRICLNIGLCRGKLSVREHCD